MKHKYRLLLVALALLSGQEMLAQKELGPIHAASRTLQQEEHTPIAEGKAKHLGNIYSSSQLPEFNHYWNQVTPENGGKWGSVERTRDQMNWTDLEAAHKLARENGFPFRFHVLIWGNQQPSWIEDLPVEEQREEIEEWFAAIAEKFPDLELIEVVNEPVNDPPSSAGSGGGNYIEALGGRGATGFGWILESFRLARKYFPDADLMLNEYNVINGSKLNSYLKIIELLKAEDLIDAVGFQAHAFSTKGVPASTLKANLDKLAATGLPLFITEMDIDGPTDEVQLVEYKRVFPVFWGHPAVHGVTLWGYRPGMWRTDQEAFLITSSGTERPALQWLREYVEASSGGITGIGPEEKEILGFYPNPVSNGMIRLKGNYENSRLKVIDLSGKQIKEIPIQNKRTAEIDLKLAPGIYLLQLIEGQKVTSGKIIVE